MTDWKDQILHNLNAPQQQAVQTVRGPLLILAGAGSGKTRTIIHRMAYIIHVEKVPAHYLAAVTFTNKAAAEMRTRLLNTAGPIGSECTVRTFHSLGLYLLRRNAQYLEYPENFSIWDDSDQQQALSAILEKFPGKFNKTQYRYFANTISSFKDKLVTPQQLPEEIDLDEYEFNDILQEVYQLYETRKTASFAVDFADLISLPCHLFEKFPELLTRWQNRYPFWLIDEYQDTNFAQYKFVQHVAARDKNLCVVGDDDQAIYGWRGADVKNILDFGTDFKDATVIKLEENYRSTKVILDIANAVIENNYERMAKHLFTSRVGGETPVLYTAADDVQEAAKVVSLVRQALIDTPASEIAVLYRTNSQSRLIEEAMLNAKVTYRVYGGLSFFARKEIKDVLAYFKLIINGQDEAAFARIINTPTRGIGDKSVEKLLTARLESGIGDFAELLNNGDQNGLAGKARDAAAKLAQQIITMRKKAASGADLGFFLDELLEMTGLAKVYEEEDRLLGSGRMEYVGELRNSLLNYQRQTSQASVGDYLQQISLITSTEGTEAETASVSLMTVHNAKGLEFETVIIAGFEKDLFPHFLAERDGDISEERRLFYVAVTRAKSRLFLTQAERRMRQGFYEQSKTSPFFNEIPPGLLRIEKSYSIGATTPQPFKKSFIPRAPTSTPAKPAASAAPKFGTNIDRQTAGGKYSSGDKIAHSNFGKGRVLRLEGEGDSQRIHILFEDGKTRKFILKFTVLQHV